MVEKVFGISPDELKLRLKLPTLEKEEVTGVESDDIPVGVELSFFGGFPIHGRYGLYCSTSVLIGETVGSVLARLDPVVTGVLTLLRFNALERLVRVAEVLGLASSLVVAKS